MSDLRLTGHEARLLSGAAGRGVAAAMELIVEAARLMKAPRLQPISQAHVASCFWTGRTSRDFVAYLAQHGAQVAVPTTLNVSYLDRQTSSCPGRAEPAAIQEAREMMGLYEQLGCEPTWTCAPYHLPSRPPLGAHVAVSESNAIVFTNSVLGARTNKMVEFLDTCAAITGLVPFAGLHTPRARRGQVLYDLRGLSASLWQSVRALAGPETSSQPAGRRSSRMLRMVPWPSQMRTSSTPSKASAASAAATMSEVISSRPRA